MRNALSFFSSTHTADSNVCAKQVLCTDCISGLEKEDSGLRSVTFVFIYQNDRLGL